MAEGGNGTEQQPALTDTDTGAVEGGAYDGRSPYERLDAVGREALDQMLHAARAEGRREAQMEAAWTNQSHQDQWTATGARPKTTKGKGDQKKGKQGTEKVPKRSSYRYRPGGVGEEDISGSEVDDDHDPEQEDKPERYGEGQN